MKTRFMIFPNKKMDIEDLRDALFSYLIAKHDKGKFVVTVENFNQNVSETEIKNCISILDFFGFHYEEILPNKENIYKAYAEKLVKSGKAYYCFCTQEELNKKRMEASEKKISYQYDRTCRNFPKDEARRKILIEENYVIRQAMPNEGQTTFHDLVYGDITTLNSCLEDQILIKSDGTPTYNFANVINDTFLNITHVTMSEDLLTSTPKYLLLYENLGFSVPKFIHYPKIITKFENILMDLLNQGFLKEAILNYIALLGWSPKSTKEFFSLEELILNFDYNHINKRPAIFDIKKLKWFNHQYIMKLSDEDYLAFVRPYLERFYNVEDKSEEWIHYLLLLFKNQINFGTEIALTTHMFFTPLIDLEEKEVSNLKGDNKIMEALKIFKEEVKKTSVWNVDSIKKVLEFVKATTNATGKTLYMPIRISVTGKKQGPNLIDCLYLLGKEKILERLNIVV